MQFATSIVALTSSESTYQLYVLTCTTSAIGLLVGGIGDSKLYDCVRRFGIMQISRRFVSNTTVAELGTVCTCDACGAGFNILNEIVERPVHGIGGSQDQCTDSEHKGQFSDCTNGKSSSDTLYLEIFH